MAPEFLWEPPPASPTLSREDVHVWCGSLEQPAWLVQRFHEVLSSAEQARAERFKFERHRRRYIVSQGQLRAILGHYLGLEPCKVQLGQGQRGKPELPQSHGGVPLCFNISHSNELNLCAVTWGRSVGVDVESIRPVPDAEQIVGRFFSEQEKAAFRALTPDQKLEAFFRCWTRKEAYLKATGDGLYRPLDGFAVSFAPGEPAQLLHAEGDAHEATRWSMRGLSPASGYVAALAVEGGWRNLECWQWVE